MTVEVLIEGRQIFIRAEAVFLERNWQATAVGVIGVCVATGRTETEAIKKLHGTLILHLRGQIDDEMPFIVVGNVLERFISPRFRAILERLDDGSWQTSSVDWIDDPPAVAAAIAKLMREAGDGFKAWLEWEGKQ